MRIELSNLTPQSIGVQYGQRIVPFDVDMHPAEARELLNAAYRAGGGDVLSLTAWWPPLKADTEFDQDLLFVLIDEDSNKMLAFAQVWTTGFIKDFAVLPFHQRKGLGRVLLNHIFQTLRTRGLQQCTLKVWPDNPTNARAFYRSNGMKEVEQ